KSASDPGYYGREYQFSGDVVVENNEIAVSFQSALGSATISRNAHGSSNHDYLIGEIFPAREIKNDRAVQKPIQHFDLIRNGADEVALLVDYGFGETVRFTFGRSEIIEVKPSKKMKGIAFWSNIDYGIVPGFVGDDLIYKADPETSVHPVFAPADNMFVGL